MQSMAYNRAWPTWKKRAKCEISKYANKLISQKVHNCKVYSFSRSLILNGCQNCLSNWQVALYKYILKSDTLTISTQY